MTAATKPTALTVIVANIPAEALGLELVAKGRRKRAKKGGA